MSENHICTHCGAEIKNNEYHHANGGVICQKCADDYCVNCDHCGKLVWNSDTYSDEIYVVTHQWEINEWLTGKFLSIFGVHDSTVIIVVTIILIIIGIVIKFLI